MPHLAVARTLTVDLVVIPRGPRLPPPAWDALVAGLPGAEQDRIAKLRRWEDRQDSALGWDTAQRLAGRYGAAVGRAEHGRPVADPPIDISLAHGGGWVVAAASVHGRVGVDVEAVRAVTPGLARRCLSAAELGWWGESADEPARRARFVRLWTAKEAYLKATGVGLGRDPREVVIDCAAAEPRLLGPEGELWRFGSSSPAGGVRVTVCRERAS